MLIFSKNHAIAIQLLCETVENSPPFPLSKKKKKSFKAFHLSSLEKEKKEFLSSEKWCNKKGISHSLNPHHSDNVHGQFT